MGENERNVLHKVQEYRKIVLLYEALDEEIDNLLMAHGGHKDRMSAEAVARYRQLARQRDDLLNEMRALEQQLQITDDEA